MPKCYHRRFYLMSLRMPHVDLYKHTKPAKSSARKRRWWVIALTSFPILILLILLGLGLFAWSAYRNPTRFAPRLEQMLAEQGVSAKISRLNFTQSEKCGVSQNICAEADVTQLKYENINMTGGKIKAVTTPVSTWKTYEQPDITSISLDIDTLELTLDTTTDNAPESNIDTAASLQTLIMNELAKVQSDLPHNMTLNIERLTVKGQPISAQVFAHIEKTNNAMSARLRVMDDRAGQLQAELTLQAGRAFLSATNLNLSSWIGEPLTVQQFDLNANLTTLSLDKIEKLDFSGIEGKGQVSYDNLLADVSVVGKASKLDITAKPITNEEAFPALETCVNDLSEGKLDAPRLGIDITALPLSIIEWVKPWIPNADVLPRELSGEVSGRVILDLSDELSLAGTSLSVKKLQGADQIVRFDKLTADIQLDAQNIYIQTGFDDSRFDIPALFPVRGQTFNGMAFVRYDTKNQRLTIDDATLYNEDFDGIHVFGGIKIADEASVEVNQLNINIDKFKSTSLMNYVARKNVSKSFYDWLEQALIAGSISGKVLLNGAIDGFFVSDDFLFDTDFTLNDFKLSYLPNNPPLSMQSGKFLLQNESLSVTTDTGNIEGVPVKGTVTMPDILNPALNVKLSVPPTNISTLAKTAGKSLAKPAVDKVTQYLNLTGEAGMDFGLNYDLMNDKFDFDILLKPRNTKVQARDFDALPITDANGEIKINELGFQHMSLTGKVVGEPLQVNIHSAMTEGNVMETTGKIGLTVAPLRFVNAIPGQEKLAQAIKDSSAISGKARFDAEFLMHDADLKTLTASSDLKGAEVRLFDILQKQKSDNLPLNIEYKGDYGELRVDLENKLAVRVDLANGHLNSLSLTDDTTVPSYADDKEILVNLHPESVDINQILRFAEAFGGESGGGESPYNIVTDVSAKKVKYGKFSLENVSVSGNLDEGLSLDSDLIKGYVQMRDEVIEGHIERVSIDELLAQLNREDAPTQAQRSGKHSKSKKSTTANKWNSTLPSVLVDIEQFVYRGVDLGEASLKLTTHNGLNAIEDFHVAGDDFYLNLTGTESRVNGKISTSLSGTLRVNDLSKHIEPFLDKGMVTADSIDVDLDLNYADRLIALALENLIAELSLRAVNVSGRELEIPPSGVLKLLDWESLMRRIRLDLDIDLMALSFDTIDGKIALNQGILTVKKLEAKTAMADIKAKGDVNLLTKVFDGFVFTVKPKPSDLLPVAGAVVSGGTGFAIGLAVDIVAGHPINQIIQLDYALSGKLTEPQIDSSAEVQSIDEDGEKVPTSSKQRRDER